MRWCLVIILAIASKLFAADYFPLKVGYKWIYEFSNSGGSISFDTTEIVKQETRNDTIYYHYYTYPHSSGARLMADTGTYLYIKNDYVIYWGRHYIYEIYKRNYFDNEIYYAEGYDPKNELPKTWATAKVKMQDTVKIDNRLYLKCFEVKFGNTLTTIQCDGVGIIYNTWSNGASSKLLWSNTPGFKSTSIKRKNFTKVEFSKQKISFNGRVFPLKNSRKE